MGIIKRRVPYFATGLLIGTVLSVILLTFWYKNRKNAESVAFPAKELRVPPVGAWHLDLKPVAGWKIVIEDSFVREVLNEKVGDPRVLTADDLRQGLLFTEEQGVGQVLTAHSIQVGVMVCEEADPKKCRAESHDLRVVSDPRGQAALALTVGPDSPPTNPAPVPPPAAPSPAAEAEVKH